MSVASPKTEIPSAARPGAAESAPHYETPASMPMYLAAFIVAICGLYAVDTSLGDSSFTGLVSILTAIGFVVSFISRRQNVAPRNIELPALTIGAFLFILAVMADPVQSFLAPASVGDDRQKSLAVLLTWLTVFRSFTLISDGALLFCCVPTIALIGLVSTTAGDSALLPDFIVFTAAAVFLMVHENFIRTRPQSGSGQQKSAVQMLFGSQVQVTAICVVLAMIVANLVAPMFQYAGTYMHIAGGLSPMNRSSTPQSSARTNYGERPEVEVGTGPVTLSDQIVMSVKAKEPAYWRGATFDKYTGTGWKNSFDALTPLSYDSLPDGPYGQERNGHLLGLYGFNIPVTPYTQATNSSHKLEQRFTLKSGIFTQLYGAAETRVLRMTELRVSIDAAGGLRLPGNDSLQNVSYEVVSDVPDLGQAAMKAPVGNYPPQIENYYIPLPSVKSEDIAKLKEQAESVATGATSAYDKVTALMGWIDKQCKYNTKAAAIPRGQDVVSYFLFTEKEGYCDSFATSLAVLCRTIGIPARVANGFLNGDVDHATGEFTVRDRDKHQWTEVYFNNVGWVRFDPTTGADDISTQAGPATEKKTSLWAAIFSHGMLPPIAILIFLLLLVYVLKVEGWDRLRPKKPVANPLGLPETNMLIVEAYDSGCSLLGKRGLPRFSWETPHEYLERASARLTEMGQVTGALDRLTALAVRYRYSKEVSTADDVAISQAALTTIRESLKKVGRRALAVSLEAAAGS